MRTPDYNRRVAVTGLGVISPVGNDKTAWDNLVNGRSGLGEITHFDVAATRPRPAGEVKDFDPSTGSTPSRPADRVEPPVRRRGRQAGRRRLRASRSRREPRGSRRRLRLGRRRPAAHDRGCVSCRSRGPRAVPPTFIANGLVDSTSGMIAIETGAIGHNVCIVSACATGTHNVAEGAEAIRRGDCIAVISGSTRDAPARGRPRRASATCAAWACHVPGGGPQTVSRPFDKTRDGFVLGEGAGSLFLEDMELAKARGAKIYAEVVGYGSAADGWDMIQPIEGGAGSARAMKMALDRRGVPADEVDLINPHGTSTPLGDKREAEAIWTVFGERAAGARKSLAVSATKSMTGPHDGRGRRLRGVRDRHVRRRAVRSRRRSTTASPTPSATCGSSPTRRPASPLRDCRTTSAWAATTARSSSSTTTATDRLDGFGARSARRARATSKIRARAPAEAAQADAVSPRHALYNPPNP